METIEKVKVTMSRDVEIEFQIPTYRKDPSGNTFFKVYSPKRCIWVWTHPDGPHIHDCDLSLAWNNRRNIDCSEREYQEGYMRALTYLSER